MLDELIKTMDYGISYGSGTLKALQNDSLPELDLLVREAIQNSSDAARKIENARFDVNFSVGTFKSHNLNLELNSLAKVLDDRYQGQECEFMEIRDTRTSGLTGPVQLSELDREDHGNYFKLVFDTGKEQTDSDSGEAGGSWGYGKSVYYRIGIGLVIFYSQIQNNSIYEERLILSLTEHETDNNSLLQEVCKESVGRAWWGKRNPENNNELLPITDSGEIQRILNIFGLHRFKEQQTGTAIIIPYIDESKLLNGIFPDECGISDDVKKMCRWKDDIVEYIQLAVQKWYAPKIFNKHLGEISGQKWLAVRVNGEPIKYTTMRPFFQLVQELYTTALSYNYNKKYESEKFTDIECVAVPSQRVVGNVSGYVAFIRINQNDISPTGGMISPYTYLRLFSKSPLNDPIVMFARTPGLILDYKIDGKWTKGLIKPEEDDEFIFAFYVPNCAANKKNEKGLGVYAGTSLGEYLRKCEKSDHMTWDDKSNLTLVSNIKGQVVAKINGKLKKDDQIEVEGTTSKLSGKLGRKLLPTRGYGKKIDGNGQSGSGNGGKEDNLEIELNPIIHSDSMEIVFKITFKNTRKVARVGIFVETETGVIDAELWEKDISDKFPVQIDRIIEAKTYALNSKKILVFEKECSATNMLINNEYSSIELIQTQKGKNISEIQITNEITNASVSGRLILKTVDRKYVCAIKEVKST